MRLRGVQGLTASRICSETVTLVYAEYDEYGDGTETVSYVNIERQGSVGVLQPKEIERLEKAGIIVRNGATIVIKEAPETQPDKVIHGRKTYRIVAWSFDYEYQEEDFDEYTVNIGTVIALCDEITMPGADS